jgi:hypothetical protein
MEHLMKIHVYSPSPSTLLSDTTTVSCPYNKHGMGYVPIRF